MYRSGHFRALLLTVAIFLPATGSVLAQSNTTPITTEVHLRWGQRPGVSRYRLQLASDSAFSDIVFDRVVAGNDYQINDLSPGRYFWRIAPLTGTLGEFSSAGVIDVSTPSSQANPASLPVSPPVNNSSGLKSWAGDAIVARGGWRAAVGDMAHPLLAHLRTAAKMDLLGINSDGVTFALDATNGVALWSTGRRSTDAKRFASASSSVLLVRSRTGLDDVIVMSGVEIASIEGASGRELWRTTLPVVPSSGIIIIDKGSAQILLVDNSTPRLFFLDAKSGTILSQIKLPQRVVGAPVASFGPNQGRIILAYDTGQIEVRDIAGTVVRSGSCGSPATTPPIFIKSRRGDFILVGTRAGLTALTAAELNPLGMVSIKDDAPRGTLAAQDLDADGSPEVIMMTDRGRVIAVNATDGKILWEAAVASESQSVAFADLDGDRVLDVVLAGGQSFGLALSGRDGSVLWRDDEPPALVANHSVALAPRSIVAMPFGSGALLIASDPSRTGLRALEFHPGTGPVKH